MTEIENIAKTYKKLKKLVEKGALDEIICPECKATGFAEKGELPPCTECRNPITIRR